MDIALDSSSLQQDKTHFIKLQISKCLLLKTRKVGYKTWGCGVAKPEQRSAQWFCPYW